MTLMHRLLHRLRVGYVRLDGTEDQLWRVAANCVPFRYRWLKATLTVDAIDSELEALDAWPDLRRRIADGDRICPFEINADSTSMRRGYVVLRAGQPIGGVVTLVS